MEPQSELIKSDITDAEIDALFDKAFEEEEFTESAKSYGIALDRLTIARDYDQLRQTASTQIRDYASLKKEIESAETGVEPEIPGAVRRARWLERASIIWLAAALYGAVAWVIYGFIVGWDFPYSWMDWKYILSGAVTFLATGVAWTSFAKRRYRRIVGPGGPVNWGAVLDRLKVDALERRGVPEMKRQAGELREAILKTVEQQGVKPSIRIAVNEIIKCAHLTTIPEAMYAVGLGEVYDTELSVITPAIEKLDFLLNTMPGGSIGIAGRRGAGKSTLIRWACRRRGKKIEGKPLLAVEIDAPVKYEVREYILHLFTTVCDAVLEFHDRPRKVPKSLDELVKKIKQSTLLELFRPHVDKLRVLEGWSTGVAAFLGLILGLWVIGSFMSAPTTSAQPAQPAAISADSTAQIDTTAQVAGVDAVNDTLSDSVAGESGTAKDGEQAASWSFFRPFEWPVVSKLTPGTAFKWMILAIVIAVLTNSVVHPVLRSYYAKYEDEEGGEDSPTGHSECKTAEDWINQIKFQSTYSAGAAGGVQLPLLTGEVTSGVEISRTQMTLPEITEGFREFVRSLAVEHHVLIGIDEMDKIENPQDSTKFLNEIKAVFGIPNCFYLVSVSESAASNFERRGLPFRDAFDSSFDDIIYVDYLSLKDSMGLLRRRVIGLPVPFLCLCYCLSGGLPRDLIRACREIVELSRGNPDDGTNPRTMSHIGDKICRGDIEAKIQAMGTKAERPDLNSFDRSFFVFLERLKRSLAASPQFPDYLRDVEKQRGRIMKDLSGTDDEAKQARERLVPLAEELVTHIYYMCTLGEIFTDSYDLDIGHSTDKRTLVTLANARYSGSTTPRFARRTLTDIRKSRKLEGFFLRGQPETAEV